MRTCTRARRPGSFRRFITAVLLGAGCAMAALQPAAAQEKEPPGAIADPGVVEEVEVRLVQVAILAQDRQGRPVTDLKPEEIIVKDQGRRLKVDFLDPLVETPRDQEPLPAVRFHVAAPGGWDEVVTSSSTPTHYLILFVDIENDDKLERPRALADMLRFVDESLGPEYRVAVLSYDGEVHLEVTFTRDRDAIANAIRRAFSRPARPQVDLQARMRSLMQQLKMCEARGGGAFVRNADEGCLRGVALEYADERRPQAEDFLAALEGLIRFAGGLEGRKSVFALSHGTAVDPTVDVVEAARAIYGNTEQLAALQLMLMTGEGARNRLDELMRLAVQEEVTFHFVDRNRVPTGDFGAKLGVPFQPGARPMQAAFTAAQMDLEELATHTGGVFIHSRSVLRGLERAMDLERGAYLLGYYVDEYRTPKQLKKIKVTTTRKGVEIVHRRGYYARRPADETLPGAITLGAALPLEDSRRDGVFLPFRIAVDPRTLGYEANGEAMEGNFTVHVRLEWSDGRTLADSYHFLNHAYPRALWEAQQIEPMVLRGWAEVPDGRYRLVAVVRNARTGQGGRLEQEVRVAGAQVTRLGAGVQ